MAAQVLAVKLSLYMVSRKSMMAARSQPMFRVLPWLAFRAPSLMASRISPSHRFIRDL